MHNSALAASYKNYASGLLAMKAQYLHFPRVVSIETFVSCNAACTFCPYPSSPRQGQRMTDATFYKIIDDLKAIPPSHKFLMTLARINEPLLDKRIQLFSMHIAKVLPNVAQIFWSNGSTLVKGKFEWMSSCRDSTLVVSLNSVDEKTHTALMGFGLAKVIGNLDYLHKLKRDNRFNTHVILNAPYQSEDEVRKFVDYCKARWPLFQSNILPFFSWQGDIPAGEKERYSSRLFEQIPTDPFRLGCGQWFDIHILASGQVTKCCIDETGLQGEEYRVANNHVLDLYRQSRKLRKNLPARQQVSACQTCTHLG